MKPVVEEIQEMNVVGVKGKCNMATTIEDIPPLWKKLMENADSIKNKAGENTYGVYWMIDEQNCWALASYEVTDTKDLPDGMVNEKIPAMKVAKFTHTGKVETLKNTYEKIMQSMTEEGLELDYAKPTIEMYDQRYKEGSEDSEIEIWMPLKE